MNAKEIITKINDVDVLAAGIEESDGGAHEGLIYVEHLNPNGRDCVGFQVESLLPEDVKMCVEFVDADDSSSFVWYRVK